METECNFGWHSNTKGETKGRVVLTLATSELELLLRSPAPCQQLQTTPGGMVVLHVPSVVGGQDASRRCTSNARHSQQIKTQQHSQPQVAMR